MEKLMSLPVEKKIIFINAGLTAFSRCGYRKCSVSDIAALAGVAKSMIFHYFGTKKNMYFYLIEFILGTQLSMKSNPCPSMRNQIFLSEYG
ncbi:MAG: hypothetical protein FD169_1787 [Bacillota bacterium]|nr:MAG: hypothetical protein FD169_1787 [Bacillota bacterium]